MTESNTTNKNWYNVPKWFCGVDIKEERWNFLIDKLSIEEDAKLENPQCNNELNISNLFKLYSHIPIGNWIPKELLLLNVFRYLNNKPLIVLSIGENGKGIKSQLTYYSLIMDDNYTDELPIIWTGFTLHSGSCSYISMPFCVVMQQQEGEWLAVDFKGEKKRIVFNWTVSDGFYITIEDSIMIKLHELGDIVQFKNCTFSNNYKIREMNILLNNKGNLRQLISN
ncbi:hypothetical protein ABK040_008115 [Willaertia magna]